MEDLTSIASRFQRDGFVLVENFLSPDELTTLQHELTRYIDQVVPHLSSRHVFYEAGDNGPIKHLTSLDLHDDFFKQMLSRPATLQVVEACLGTPAEPFASEVFYKHAHVGTETPYHQDNAYLHFDPADGVVVWIALDDVTLDNGAMHYRKGAYELGDLDHFETNLPLFSKQLSAELDPAQNPEVPALVKQGGAAIHHIQTPHRAGPNRTDHDRRAFVGNYQGSRARVDEQRKAAHDAYTAKIYNEG